MERIHLGNPLITTFEHLVWNTSLMMRHCPPSSGLAKSSVVVGFVESGSCIHCGGMEIYLSMPSSSACCMATVKACWRLHSFACFRDNYFTLEANSVCGNVAWYKETFSLWDGWCDWRKCMVISLFLFMLWYLLTFC